MHAAFFRSLRRNCLIQQLRLWGNLRDIPDFADEIGTVPYPHFESPQFRHVMHPSIITTAAVLHFAHSCAPSGK